jgi:hypothetical protein
LSRFPRWASIHRHPYGAVIPSQRSSELLASITEEARQRFFLLQGKRRIEREYLAYDITSISSYSKSYGRSVMVTTGTTNAGTDQPGLAFRQQSRLPFYYRKLRKHPRCKDVEEAVGGRENPGLREGQGYPGPGFFSAANINDMYHHHMKFLIAARLSLKIVQTNLMP